MLKATNKTKMVLASATFFSLCFCSSAWAQAGDSEVHVSDGHLYGGMTAGEEKRSGEPPRSGLNRLEWVGFQPEAARTRVFLRTTRPVRYRVNHDRSSNQIVVTIEGVRITRSNFRRFIDAQYFDRAVERIDVKEMGGERIEVTLSLMESVEPVISDDDGVIYLDFPHDSARDGAGAARRSETVRDEKRDAQRYASAEEIERRSEDSLVRSDEGRESLEADREEEHQTALDEDEEVAQLRTPRSEEPPTLERRSWALPLALGGLVVMGGGAGVHLMAESRRDVVTSVPMSEVVPITQQEARDIEQQANRMDTVALSMLVVGGVATVVGTGAWFLRPDQQTRGSTVSLSPSKGQWMVDWTIQF